MKKKTVLEKRPEAGKRAEELRGQGFSLRDISDKLQEEFSISVNHMTISNYFQKKGELTAQAIQSNEELKKEFEEEAFNTIEEMKYLRERLREFIDGFVEKDSVKVSAINSMIKLLEFQEKKLGGFVQQNIQTQQNVNIQNQTDISVFIQNHLKKLEEKGYIKILQTLPTEEMEDAMVEKKNA